MLRIQTSDSIVEYMNRKKMQVQKDKSLAKRRASFFRTRSIDLISPTIGKIKNTAKSNSSSTSTSNTKNNSNNNNNNNNNNLNINNDYDKEETFREEDELLSPRK